MAFSRNKKEFGRSLGILQARNRSQHWNQVVNFNPPSIKYTSLTVKRAYIDAFIGTIRGYWEGSNDCSELKKPRYNINKYVLNPKKVKDFYINGYIESYYTKNSY
jgi:hypothetical protein